MNCEEEVTLVAFGMLVYHQARQPYIVVYVYTECRKVSFIYACVFIDVGTLVHYIYSMS